MTAASLNKPNALRLTSTAMLAMATLGLAACQSTPTAPVIHRANATFETTGLGTTKLKAQTNALANAKKTCGYHQPIILEDTVNYNGVLGEQAGRILEQVGGIAGAILGTGVPDISREDDYEYNISFRCD